MWEISYLLVFVGIYEGPFIYFSFLCGLCDGLKNLVVVLRRCIMNWHVPMWWGVDSVDCVWSGFVREFIVVS